LLQLYSAVLYSKRFTLKRKSPQPPPTT